MKIPQYSLILLTLLFLCLSVKGQQQNSPSGSSLPFIQHTPPDNYPDTHYFEIIDMPAPHPQPLPPPMEPYSYLWWMGDNGFCFTETVSYAFQQDAIHDSIDMLEITTGNYGTSGPPPMAHRLWSDSYGQSPLDIIPPNNIIHLQNYRMPVALDVMYLIVSYKVPNGFQSVPGSGEIELILPPKTQLMKTDMSLNPTMTPNGEVLTTSLNRKSVWEFNNLEAGKTHSMLIPVGIGRVYDGDLDFKVNYKLVDLDTITEQEIEGIHYDELNLEIMESHDPNCMNENSAALNDCPYGGKPIHYTVQFQNEGEAQTDSITIVCQLDKKLNLNSIRDFKIPGIYNKTFNQAGTRRASYDISSSDHTLTFVFNKLVLLSTQNPNCTNLDLTREQVSFTVDVLPNYTFGEAVQSYSDIYFDRNDAIRTDTAITNCNKPLTRSEGGGFSKESPIVKWPPNKPVWITIAAIVGIGLLIFGFKRKKK